MGWFNHQPDEFWRIFRVNLLICIQVTLVDAGYSEKGSWGETRIARVSYVDPVLLRLARRSYELYAELAEISGEKLMWHGSYCNGGARISKPWI